MTKRIKPILEKLDLDAIGAELGVKPRSFRLAQTRDLFPSSWYPTIIAACDEAGIDCPFELFNWRSSPDGRSTALACDHNRGTRASCGQAPGRSA